MIRKENLSAACKALTLALVCVHFAPISEAQKTAQRWNQQSTNNNNNNNNNNNQQSVYGGYQQQQNFEQQRQPVAPVQQKGRQQQSYQQTSSSSSVDRQNARPVQPVYETQQQETSYESQSASNSEADAEPAMYGAVNGQPGRDFPAYTRIPKTSFSCDGLPYDYGMYADEETGCQAYHLCYNGRKESFLCGVGTVFNQRILHCDYWYSVECNKSSQYYSSNAYMGSSQPEPGPAEASGSSQSSYSSSRPVAATANRPAAPNSYNNNNNNNNNNRQQQQQQQQSFNQQQQQIQENY